MDPVVLFERAASVAATVVEYVRPEQRDAPTPCTEWDVEAPRLAHGRWHHLSPRRARRWNPGAARR